MASVHTVSGPGEAKWGLSNPCKLCRKGVGDEGSRRKRNSRLTEHLVLMMTDQKVTQIRIGQHKCGLVGFQAILEEVAERFPDKPDDVVTSEILKRLSGQNYIPPGSKEKYGQAVLREFNRFLGRPVEDDGSGGLEIKILGEGCAVCDGMENRVMEVLGEIGLAADVEHVRDPKQIAAYKVKGTPALIVNGESVIAGKSPSTSQLKQWIEEAGFRGKPGKSKKETVFLKNIPFSKPQGLAGLVDYEEGRVVSRTFAQKPALTLTLFAFDKGEGISTHTAPGDALIQVLDGEAMVTIDGKDMTLTAGQVVAMPANVPHAVTALKRFKMLLTVVK